jgi:hypothetical protein
MRRTFVLFFVVLLSCVLRAQDSTLDEYVGTYKFPEGSVVPSVDIKLENGVLIGVSSAGSSALERISNDTFNLVQYNGTVYFIRDANKKVEGIKILAQDTVLEGKKESAGLASRYFIKEWLCIRKNLIPAHLS